MEVKKIHSKIQAYQVNERFLVLVEESVVDLITVLDYWLYDKEWEQQTHLQTIEKAFVLGMCSGDKLETVILHFARKLVIDAFNKRVFAEEPEILLDKINMEITTYQATERYFIEVEKTEKDFEDAFRFWAYDKIGHHKIHELFVAKDEIGDDEHLEECIQSCAITSLEEYLEFFG